MGMKIPYWKLKRELRRIKDQLLGALIYPLEVFRTRRYDREKRQILRIRMGANPLSDKVAVFLVGHPASQRGGIEHTLKHLVEQRLSVLLVINDSAKCMEDDWYLSYCSAVISRPNYGYDFGGYRDGLLWLKEQDHALSELLLINDSIWFPLLDGDATIQCAREANETVFGLLALEQTVEANQVSNLRPHRAGSFFVFIKGEVLERFEFWYLWQKMVLSDIKRAVIRRGEHALSDVLVALGQSFDFSLSRLRIQQRVMSMTDAQIASLSEELDPTEKPADLELARKTLSKRLSYPNPLWASPEILLRLGLLAFIKKSLEFQFPAALLKLAHELSVEPGIYSEIIRGEVSERLNWWRVQQRLDLN